MPNSENWDAIAKLLDVSRETTAKLTQFVKMLRHWQGSINLVGRGTLDDVWDRHVADSAQLLLQAPDARRWVDLGSGAGFPGMVLAILLGRSPGASVELIESNQKKAAFLRVAAQEIGAAAFVRVGRIERLVTAAHPPVDVVVARALAPLSRLLDQAEPLLQQGATALFLKGQDIEAELTEIPECWRNRIELFPSRTECLGKIVRVAPAGKVRPIAAGFL